MAKYDWKERVRKQIDQVADELKAGAYDTITASRLVCAATIRITIDPDNGPKINYDIDIYPRAMLENHD